MDKRKIFASLATIGAASALLIGATFAFFSDTETSEDNTFSAGTLEIDILDQNADTPFESEALVTNWAPGDQNFVNFDIKNVGSLPINLRGFAAGTWGSSELDGQNMVYVTKVERWNGASWETLATGSPAITGYFYYSPDGTNTSLFEVSADTRAQLRLTVKFDENAGDDFQGATFTSSIQVEAKQVNDTTTWP